MQKIKDFWKHQESPSINGIIYPDESIQLIIITIDWGPPVKYSFELGTQTSISELESKNELEWSDCAVMARLNLQDKNFEVLSGEASYGSDGFIAVINSSNHELCWLAFFNCSNPFNKLEVEGNELRVWSTHGNLWSFPIDSPSQLTID